MGLGGCSVGLMAAFASIRLLYYKTRLVNLAPKVRLCVTGIGEMSRAVVYYVLYSRLY